MLYNRLALLSGLSAALVAQAQSTTEIYQIQSGSYVVVGGLVGVMSNSLPNANQTFLELQYDFDAGTADMRIRGEDFQTVFREFEDGAIMGGQVRFVYPTSHPDYPFVTEPAQVDYTVQLGDATVWVNGSVTSRPVCCDIPYEFRHDDVRATILTRPPPDPVGIYAYEGFTPGGELLVTGLLAITNRGDPLRGTWKLSGVGEPIGIGPQIGRGELSGTLNDGSLYLNLNPGTSDDNVFLNGSLVGDSYTGEWTHSTFLGPVTNGTFVAERRVIRMMSAHWRTNGFAFECVAPAGMLCAVEYTDDAVGGDWKELFRFTTEERTREWVDDEAPPGGRFYRLRVIDATSRVPLAECAHLKLAEYLEIPAQEIQLVSAGATEFPDSCCGCLAQPCAEVITPGYTILFQVGAELHEVRACSGRMIYCNLGAGTILDNCE